MDEAAIEKAGIKPLKPYFKQIDTIKNTKGFAASDRDNAQNGHSGSVQLRCRGGREKQFDKYRQCQSGRIEFAES